MNDKENYIKCNIDCTTVFYSVACLRNCDYQIAEYFNKSKCRESKYFESELF